MDYSTYFVEKVEKKEKNLSVFLQVGFILIGALIIISSAILFSNEPEKADAILFSPVSQNSQDLKKDFSYRLLYADSKKFVYKETTTDSQSLKLVNIGTNLSTNIISAKRTGFIGFLSEDTLCFLEDNEGLGKFKVVKYDVLEKTSNPFLAFQSIKELKNSDIDYLISISPDKTRLLITHESGIVIYNLNDEKEITVLENDNCTNSQDCLIYNYPKWLSNTTFLVKQTAKNAFNYLLVNTDGAIISVLPQNFTDLSLNPNKSGLPFIGVTDAGLHIIEPKKTSLVLSADKDKKYTHPVWFGANQIVSFADISSVPEIIRVDKTGRKISALMEFSNNTLLFDLITDQTQENIYFLTQTKNDTNVTASFYKMGIKEDKPISFYSISKNL